VFLLFQVISGAFSFTVSKGAKNTEKILLKKLIEVLKGNWMLSSNKSVKVAKSSSKMFSTRG
jgi:hypothetical protein